MGLDETGDRCQGFSILRWLRFGGTTALAGAKPSANGSLSGAVEAYILAKGSPGRAAGTAENARGDNSVVELVLGRLAGGVWVGGVWVGRRVSGTDEEGYYCIAICK